MGAQKIQKTSNKYQGKELVLGGEGLPKGRFTWVFLDGQMKGNVKAGDRFPADRVDNPEQYIMAAQGKIVPASPGADKEE